MKVNEIIAFNSGNLSKYKIVEYKNKDLDSLYKNVINPSRIKNIKESVIGISSYVPQYMPLYKIPKDDIENPTPVPNNIKEYKNVDNNYKKLSHELLNEKKMLEKNTENKIDGPVSNFEDPLQEQDGPVSNFEDPLQEQDGPVSNFEDPSQEPEGPVSNFEDPSQEPEGPVSNFEDPSQEPVEDTLNDMEEYFTNNENIDLSKVPPGMIDQLEDNSEPLDNEEDDNNIQIVKPYVDDINELNKNTNEPEEITLSDILNDIIDRTFKKFNLDYVLKLTIYFMLFLLVIILIKDFMNDNQNKVNSLSSDTPFNPLNSNL